MRSRLGLLGLAALAACGASAPAGSGSGASATSSSSASASSTGSSGSSGNGGSTGSAGTSTTGTSSTGGLDAGGYNPIVVAGDPRAWYFRKETEGALVQSPDAGFTAWSSRLLALSGIEGKVFSEEEGRPDALLQSTFVEYKQQYPNQLVLLHFNGSARDPRFDAGNGNPYFAGHWIYFVGTHSTAAIGPTDIAIPVAALRVNGAPVFSLDGGRPGPPRPDDLVITSVFPDGGPNWWDAEQVTLTDLDAGANVIFVKRAQYGSVAKSFPAGAYLAAHATQGPWGNAHLDWLYNFATTCPRDDAGLQAGDVLANELVAELGDGGIISSFDGVEFDVMFDQVPRGQFFRQPDVDGDGKGDPLGVVNGLQVYGAGVMNFCARLRAQLSDKLLLADGQELDNQRCEAWFNGIESEGWPALGDSEIVDWSGGINRHDFWNQKGRAPHLSYVLHKFQDSSGNYILPPYGITRLVEAAAVLTGSAFSALTPPSDGGVFDELDEGEAGLIQWLGLPLGPAVHLAASSGPDLLRGQGHAWPAAFISRLQPFGSTLSVDADAGELVVTGIGSGGDGGFGFVLPGVAMPDGGSADDLYVQYRITADPEPGYRASRPRMAVLSWTNATTANDLSLTATNAMTWSGSSFLATGSFRNLAPGSVDLVFWFEGTQPVRLQNLIAHVSADAMVREYQNGAVLANPSLHAYDFDLGALFPGESFQRIQGSADQDPGTNDGRAVSGVLSVPARDAIFLRKR